jgi:hypothetical protein
MTPFLIRFSPGLPPYCSARQKVALHIGRIKVNRAVYNARFNSSTIRSGSGGGKSCVTNPIGSDVLPGVFPLEGIWKSCAAETSANSNSIAKAKKVS